MGRIKINKAFFPINSMVKNMAQIQNLFIFWLKVICSCFVNAFKVKRLLRCKIEAYFPKKRVHNLFLHSRQDLLDYFIDQRF